MATVNRQSEKYIEARDSLPQDLRPIFEELVEQYAFHTTKLYGSGYVAYKVLAALVVDGWRLPRLDGDSQG